MINFQVIPRGSFSCSGEYPVCSLSRRNIPQSPAEEVGFSLGRLSAFILDVESVPTVADGALRSAVGADEVSVTDEDPAEGVDAEPDLPDELAPGTAAVPDELLSPPPGMVAESVVTAGDEVPSSLVVTGSATTIGSLVDPPEATGGSTGTVEPPDEPPDEPEISGGGGGGAIFPCATNIGFGE